MVSISEMLNSGGCSSEHIGFVAVTKETPARFATIKAFVRVNDLRPGEPVAIIDPGSGAVKAFGIVEDMQGYTMVGRLSDLALSEATGSDSSTEPTVIREASIRILQYLDERPVLLDRAYRVRRLCPQDSEMLWGSISERRRILAGFIVSGNDIVPAYYHADYIMGPEAAHFNIGGKTGLATKTSYLKFLVFSVIKWSKEVGEAVNVILFNVKRLDFIDMVRVPESLEDLKQCMENWGRGLPQRELELYVRMYKESGIHEVAADLARRGMIRIYHYEGDPYAERIDKRISNKYKYGLSDLTEEALIASLFEEEDEASGLQINLLHSLYKHGYFKRSFKELSNILDLIRLCSIKSRDQNQKGCDEVRYIIDQRPDIRTVEALKRRLEGFMDKASRVIDRNNPSSHPITYDAIRSNPINVIQLYGLNDSEKRLVVISVLKEVIRGLEEEQRSGKSRRVVVVIDELNKYAPRTKSPIKDPIVEISARGRDLGLSIFSAEQFPSEVDSQVIGNTSTIAIGRTDYAELDEKLYRSFGTLKTLGAELGKGEIMVSHPVYGSPLVLRFPPPLDDIMRSCGGDDLIW